MSVNKLKIYFPICKIINIQREHITVYVKTEEKEDV